MKKGEKLSDEHKAKMKAGAAAKRAARSIKVEPSATKNIPNQVPNAPINPATVAHKVVEDPVADPVVDRKGVTASGRTKKVVAQEFIMNSNLGPSAAITAQLPGQKEQIKKELKVKVPKLSTPVPKPPEKTVDGLKSDDPKAIKAMAPFSYNAIFARLALGPRGS